MCCRAAPPSVWVAIVRHTNVPISKASCISMWLILLLLQGWGRLLVGRFWGIVPDYAPTICDPWLIPASADRQVSPRHNVHRNAVQSSNGQASLLPDFRDQSVCHQIELEASLLPATLTRSESSWTHAGPSGSFSIGRSMGSMNFAFTAPYFRISSGHAAAASVPLPLEQNDHCILAPAEIRSKTCRER